MSTNGAKHRPAMQLVQQRHQILNLVRARVDGVTSAEAALTLGRTGEADKVYRDLQYWVDIGRVTVEGVEHSVNQRYIAVDRPDASQAVARLEAVLELAQGQRDLIEELQARVAELEAELEQAREVTDARTWVAEQLKRR